MRVLALVAVVGVIALFVYAVYAIAKMHDQKRLIKGLKDPVVFLSRKERREHARKLIDREQDEYDLKRQQQIESTINQFLERQS